MGKIKVKDQFDALRKITDIATNLESPAACQMAIELFEARKASLLHPVPPGMPDPRD